MVLSAVNSMCKYSRKVAFIAISLHSPERMTVNHDVTGSSPVGGATKVRRAIYGPFSISTFADEM